MVKGNTAQAKKNLAKVLKGKKVLFLENDNGLYNGLQNIEKLLKEKKIEYECIFDINEVPYDDVIARIMQADAIIFQTQWVYDVSRKLRDFMFAYKNKMIVIECFVGTDPTWYYKPEVAHDVYVINCPEFEDDSWREWRFYKLSETAYWDYKNQFDK